MSWRRAFFVGPLYDSVFFLLTPLLAVILAGAAYAVLGPGAPVESYLGGTTVLALGLRTLIHAHLVIVFARTHLNGAVFARAPLRFVVVPVVLLSAMIASSKVLAVLVGVVIVWDAYHSSMQTFGLGRIYDARIGADRSRGRLADIACCHAIYLGPLLCGPLYGVLVGAVANAVGGDFPAALPYAQRALASAAALRVAVATMSCAAVGWYVVATVGAARRGAPVSWLKHGLYASTGVASLIAWGTNPLGQGLLIVNVFHAVQYFGLVAYTERDSLAARFGLRRRVALQVFMLLASVGLVYGFLFGAAPDVWLAEGPLARVVLSLVNTVALLHFWYDGFIWSVRRGDVAASGP